MHSMLSIVVGILIFLPPSFAFLPFIDPYPKYTQLNLPSGDFGPDSVALDPSGKGPYVDVGDGRILKYNGTRFVDFTYTSPNRTKEECDGVSDIINLGEKCGRPLGFSFDYETGDLYIVDVYSGLYKVGPEGGQATLLAHSAGGVLLHAPNGVEFDPIRRVVYITDTSQNYTYKEFLQGKPTPPGDSSGRLLEYNPQTGNVRVLLERLPRPNGPAVSRSGEHVLFSSYTTQQIYKYSLEDSNYNNEAKPLMNQKLPGIPLKTKRARTLMEAFWVPVNVVVKEKPTMIINPFAFKFDLNGQILVRKNIKDQFPQGQLIDSVQEYDIGIFGGGSELYVGSLGAPYVGIYTRW